MDGRRAAACFATAGGATAVAEAMRLNLPIAIANHAARPHAFDLFADNDRSRAVVSGLSKA
jgi:hypothetical protein